MRHYTKLALAGALLLTIFVLIGAFLTTRSTGGESLAEAFSVELPVVAPSPTTTTAPTTTTTIVEPVTTTAAPEPVTVPEPTTPPLPASPGCSTWATQAESQAWMDANGADHDTSRIDTNADGRPCTLHFAPPPAPAPPTPVAPAPAAAPPTQTVGLPSILIAIRGCESGHDYTARNPRSSASGAFQFIDSTWRAYGDSRWARAYLAPRDVQDAAALRLYRASGTSPWNASRSCWG